MEKEFIEREFFIRYRIKEAKLLVLWTQRYEISFYIREKEERYRYMNFKNFNNF